MSAEAPTETSDPTEWLDLYGDYLYRYAMFRLRNATVAEDLVQDTLLAALQSRDKYRGQSHEKTWLVGILKHKILDHFRRIERNREVSDEPEGAEDYHPFDKTGEWTGHWITEEAPRDWQVDASAILEQKEFWEVFNRCLSELPEKTAAAFTLREVDGLSSEEICDVLNLSRNNLWVMLHRARLKLRSSLEAHWFTSKSVDQPSQKNNPQPAYVLPRLEEMPKLEELPDQTAQSSSFGQLRAKAEQLLLRMQSLLNLQSYRSSQTLN